MVVEHEVLPILVWLAQGIPKLLAVMVVMFVLGTLLGFLVSTARNGPAHGARRTGTLLLEAVIDLLHLSPRRVLAIAILAFREALRRKVIVFFILFVVVMLFAGWFLDVESSNPARSYLSFVMWWSNLLSIVLAGILSAMSLPADIRSRTIYTVVTKPVYGWEILLGRIVGFAAIGTALLLPMWLVSYGFVVRGLHHRHVVDADSLSQLGADDRSNTDLPEVTTDLTAHHRHNIVVDDEGHFHMEMSKGHTHRIRPEETADSVVYHTGPPTGDLQARVVVYGKLSFIDREGNPTDRGINVGSEWAYRSYIEGKTQHTAIWTFEGITEERYGEGLPLEMSTRVFRSYKGIIEQRIRGSITIRNPDSHRESIPIPFSARETRADRHTIPRELLERRDNGTTRKIDLFDLVHDGQVEILIRCEERSQYFGVAQADLYLRPRNNWFALNFFKGYMSIWVQMVMVIAIGVMFSTVVSTPVAMLATMSVFIFGYFTDFVLKLGTGELPGGGPIESMIRTLTQMNQVSPLDIGKGPLAIIHGIDFLFRFVLLSAMQLLPDFGSLLTVRYVADGFNISANLLTQQLLSMMAYVLVTSLIGYFLLKTREIAA